jgi:hypothetical protein
MPLIMAVMIDALIDIQRSEGSKPWPWIMLIVGQCWALYTHGFMAVGVFAVNCWILVLVVRRWKTPVFWVWLKGWLFSEFTTVVFYAPMLPLFLARAGGIQNPFAIPLTFSQFATEIWNYSFGVAWENVFDPLFVRVLLATLLITLMMGLVFSLRVVHYKRILADMIWLTLLIGGLCLLYDQRDPSFHPRYAIFVTTPLLVVLALTIESGLRFQRLGTLASGSIVFFLVVSSVVSLNSLYTGQHKGYRHASSELVAETLRHDLGPQDGIVVIAPHDFTLNYYGIGSTPLAWARFDEGLEHPEDLLEFIRGKQQIAVLRNTNERSDSRRILRFYLERYGFLSQQQFFEGYDIVTYQLDPDTIPEPAHLTSVNTDWTQLRLQGISTEGGDVVTIALQWQATDLLVPGERLATSVRLVDPVTGITLASADNMLLSDHGDPTDLWIPGLATMQYFILPLAPGTPPIDADIQLAVYDTFTKRSLDLRDQAGSPAGQQLALGKIRLGKASERWQYGDNALPWTLKPTLVKPLIGYAIDRDTISPGGSLGIILEWALNSDELEDLHPVIKVIQDGKIIAQDSGPPLGGRAETLSGNNWIDLRKLNISNDLKQGLAQLIITTDTGELLSESLVVSGFTRTFDQPQVQYEYHVDFANDVRLLGFDFEQPRPLNSNSTLSLTLYWEALADGTETSNYKVFAQMLGEDGRLVGQHDGIPVFESRPFSGWLAGEFVMDVHPMLFNGPYSGKIHIQVGIYDPVTSQRILTIDGKDAVILSLELMVDPAP